MYGAHAAAAKQQKERQQQEEEEMTKYMLDDVNNDWEFKIVRSTTNAFKKPQAFQQVIEEEALAGWKLVEKFDDGRIRFKRPASAARNDFNLPRGVDPYRTQYGISEGKIAGIVTIAIIVIIGIIVLITVLAENGVIF